MQPEPLDEPEPVLGRVGEDLLEHAGVGCGLVEARAVLSVEAVLGAVDDPHDRVAHELHPAQFAAASQLSVIGVTESGPLPTSAYVRIVMSSGLTWGSNSSKTWSSTSSEDSRWFTTSVQSLHSLRMTTCDACGFVDRVERVRVHEPALGGQPDLHVADELLE